MKPLIQKNFRQWAALALLTAVGPLTLCAAPTNQTASLEIHPSVFAFPNNPAEGRDPFFPNSTHVYGSNVDAKTAPSLSDLVLHTILGTPPHVFALINNHTFGPGEDGDVATKSGQRLHIRCLRIDAAAGTTTIEAGDTIEELHLSGSP